MFEKPRIIINGSNTLLGDLLMETPAIRSLKKEFANVDIYYKTTKDSPARVMFKNNPNIKEFVFEDFEIKPTDKQISFVCSDAFNAGVRYGITMMEAYQMFLDVEGGDIRYDYFIDEEDFELAKGFPLPEGVTLDRVIFCCMNSHSCTSNDPKIMVPNKCFSQDVWDKVAVKLKEDGWFPVSIGSKTEEEKLKDSWCGGALYGYPIRTIAAAMRKARGVISVDCGARHLAAACGANLYTISCAIPLSLIRTVPVHQEQCIFEENLPIDGVDPNHVYEKAIETFQL